VQYEKSSYTLLQGRGLAPLIKTVNGASTLLQGTDERCELSVSGYYLQQNFNYKSLLYLTGAIRIDGSFRIWQRPTKPKIFQSKR
jgi:hypothetical protein